MAEIEIRIQENGQHYRLVIAGEIKVIEGFSLTPVDSQPAEDAQTTQETPDSQTTIQVDPPEEPRIEMIVSAIFLNVRSEPSLAGTMTASPLRTGDIVHVSAQTWQADGYTWRKILEGIRSGSYCAEKGQHIVFLKPHGEPLRLVADRLRFPVSWDGKYYLKGQWVRHWEYRSIDPNILKSLRGRNIWLGYPKVGEPAEWGIKHGYKQPLDVKPVIEIDFITEQGKRFLWIEHSEQTPLVYYIKAFNSFDLGPDGHAHADGGAYVVDQHVVHTVFGLDDVLS